MNLQSKPRDLCVVRLSAIGDTCHALAVIRRLQDNWPECRITWIIGRTEATLMSVIPEIEFVVFDKARGGDAYREVRATLAGRQFDIALCMHASWRVNRLYRGFPARCRLGFDRARARDFQWLFTDARIPAAHGEHALEAMMGFATAIGAAEKPLRWDIPLPAADQDFARRYLEHGRPLVVVSPLSSQRSRNYRNWSIENYAAVIRHLETRHGCRVVVTGGPSDPEKAYGQALAAASRADNLAGGTTLRQLAALIQAADCIICPDSGPAHMATALGTPVIGLYATSNPGRTGPYLSREYTVDRYPDAVRRYLGRNSDDIRWGRRVRHPNAMDLVTILDVTDKIDELFSKIR